MKLLSTSLKTPQTKINLIVLKISANLHFSLPGVPVQRSAGDYEDLQQEEVVSDVHVPPVLPALWHARQPVLCAT